MADTPAAIGIRLRFVNIWIFGTATSWPPCCCFLRLVGGRRQRAAAVALSFGDIFISFRRYLRLIAKGTTFPCLGLVQSSHCTGFVFGFPPTPACSLVRECSDWGFDCE